MMKHDIFLITRLLDETLKDYFTDQSNTFFYLFEWMPCIFIFLAAQRLHQITKWKNAPLFAPNRIHSHVMLTSHFSLLLLIIDE